MNGKRSLKVECQGHNGHSSFPIHEYTAETQHLNELIAKGSILGHQSFHETIA